MRLTLTLVLAGLLLTTVLLTTACMGGSRRSQPPPEPPKTGRVLAVSDGAGTLAISLGSRDGVRPGDTLAVVRDGKVITSIVIHAVKETQAVGTAIGGLTQGDVRPGDQVIED